MSNQIVYDYMYANPALDYNQNLTAFYDAYVLTSSGKINALFNEKAKSLEYSTQMNQLNDKYDDLIGLLGQESSLFELLPISPTWDEFSQYQSEVSGLNSQYNTLMTEIPEIISEIKSLSLVKSQQLLTDLNTIDNPSEHQALLEKQVLNVVLNSELHDNTLSSSDLTLLQSIANECPSQGGRAVSWARSIVTFNDQDAFWNDTLCEVVNENIVYGTEKGDFESKISDQYNTYPNPSNGSIVVNAPEKFVGRIRIIDNLGKEAYNDSYVNGNTLNIPGGNGVYNIIWLNEKNQKVISKKIVFFK